MMDAFRLRSNRFFNYVFVKHPEEQSMTYFQHLKHACCYSVQALGCSLVFMVHGFVPCLFEKLDLSWCTVYITSYTAEQTIMKMKKESRLSATFTRSFFIKR